jgi:hypothetical protein
MPEKIRLVRILTARAAPDQSQAELQQPVGYLAGVHDVGRKDEEWHGDRGEIAENAIEHHFGAETDVTTRNKQIKNARCDHGDAHGQAGDRGYH